MIDPCRELAAWYRQRAGSRPLPGCDERVVEPVERGLRPVENVRRQAPAIGPPRERLVLAPGNRRQRHDELHQTGIEQWKPQFDALPRDVRGDRGRKITAVRR